MDGPHDIDDSLYRLQLADDAWRVLYLRGAFEGFTSSDADRSALEEELGLLGDETGLCFFLGGIEHTNCRDGREHHITVSARRSLFVDSAIQGYAFSLGERGIDD